MSRFASSLTHAITLTLVASVAVGSRPAAAQTPPACSGSPMLVTANCVDPVYDRPVIDSEMDLTTPAPHHRVSGHVEGTTKRFTFNLPPKAQWEGRFFHLVYPLDDENAEDGVPPDFGPPARMASGTGP